MNNARPFDSFTQQYFSQNPMVHKPRSVFDRSMRLKDTLDFDYLNPIFLDEILPGDTMSLDANVFVRLSQAQKVPLLDNAYLDFFFFFVPSRLVWSNWEKFNGASDDPIDINNPVDYTIPQISLPLDGVPVGSLGDKFGLPTEQALFNQTSALPFRCYARIWNEWFRDQDLQDSTAFSMGDGPDLIDDYPLLKRGKRHDYFTSCRPWPQKHADILIPTAAAYAPVGLVPTATENNAMQVRIAGTDALAASQQLAVDSGGTFVNVGASQQYVLDPNGRLRTELQDYMGTINDLRLAFQMQQLYELDARGGTRYVELIYSTWGVVAPDFRLQRSEYLGGGHIKFNSHPVAQTAPTSGSNVQGQLAAFGTASNLGSRIGFSKSFVEHGYVIGLCAARGELTYQQGVNRLWSRLTRFDFFQPALENIGEQAVLNEEIFAGTTDDTEPFGYQERYAEYKYKPSEIHGEFRSTYSTPLDQWHLAEEFSALPVLNDEFIQSNTPIDRNLPITTSPPIYYDAYYSIKHARVMQTRPVPLSLQRL